MPFLLSAHFSYKQQGVKVVCPAFTHGNNFYRDQVLLQWCARLNGLIEGDGRTPMNDRNMGKQRKSVFLVMRLFNLISTISSCFYKRFKIHWFLSGRNWNQVVWYSLHQDVAHVSNISTAIVWMFWKFFFWAIWGALRNLDDYVLHGEREHGPVRGSGGMIAFTTQHVDITDSSRAQKALAWKRIRANTCVACSQTLYFLFKVRRVIKYKPQGIY